MNGGEVFKYFEWRYLTWIRDVLTLRWHIVQGGTGPEALNIWQEIFVTLELDTRAIRDLMLLAHSGKVGRAEANEILWTLLSDHALRHTYLDLSKTTTRMVKEARQNIDRPPAGHEDNEWWQWWVYSTIRNPRFDPLGAPNPDVDIFEILTGPGGAPLEPPDCWRFI